MPTEQYIANLKEAITRLHGVDSVHLRTDHVTEIFRGEVLWEGDVETFALVNHPKTRMLYAWAYFEDGQKQFAIILRLPPVDRPIDAVRAHTIAEARKRREQPPP